MADLPAVSHGISAMIYNIVKQRVSETYLNQKEWMRMLILSTARVGRFSSDRSIREHCRDIWNVSASAMDKVCSQNESKYKRYRR